MKKYIFLLFVISLPIAMSAQSHSITRKPQTKENVVKKNITKRDVSEKSTSDKKLTEFDKQHELARMGDSEAQRYVGYCYQYGEGVYQSAVSAFYWYNKAAQNGNLEAQTALGDCYLDGYGTKQDYSKAFYWYQEAAIQGLAEAQSRLGYCYEWGKGTPKNYEEAERYYKKALEQQPDNTHFQALVGWIYYKKKDYGIAKSYFQKAAKAGDAEGYNGLAYLSEDGYGTKKDPNEAIRLINIAISLEKNNPRYLDTKGEFLLNHGDFEGAKRIWNQCLSLDKDFDKGESSFVIEMKKRLR